MAKLVVIKLEGDWEWQGFRVTVEIGEEGNRPQIEAVGKLPTAPELIGNFKDWQQNYRSLEIRHRIKPGKIICDGDIDKRLAECNGSAKQVGDRLQTWLDSKEFRPIDRRLREQLNPQETIRVLIRTEDRHLQKLPWHLWDLFDRYPKAELALSPSEFERPEIGRVESVKTNVRILAILGHSEGIDIEKDRRLLEELPGAETLFLVEPKRQDISDRLWEQPWDIIFFAGHSQTEGETGRIYINPEDSLTIAELWYALRKAVEAGLQLAIFNSCDGLGLARQLDDLQIPQIVVMRELVPDRVAQAFLKHFLQIFSSGKPLYLAMREARERLQGLEDDYPCATWLPAIVQNPAAIPPTWNQLRARSPEELLTAQPTNINRWKTPTRILTLTPGKLVSGVALLLGMGLVSWQFALPKSAVKVNNIGFEHFQAGRLIEAGKFLRLATLLNPDNRAAHYTLGWLCEEVRDFDCARQKYRISAKLGLDSAYSNLARLYIVEDEDYAAAAALLWQGLERAEDADPRVIYAFQKNLGWTRLKQSRYWEASEHLETAIKLDGQRAAAHCLLARVKEAMGDEEGAIASWETCLKYATPQNSDEDIWIDMAGQRLK